MTTNHTNSRHGASFPLFRATGAACAVGAPDLIIARCAAIAAEGAYMAAHKRHRQTKGLRKAWERSKAYLAAMEARHG